MLAVAVATSTAMVMSGNSVTTAISKVSLTEAVPSLAVTWTESVFTSPDAGVPEKVRVVALKLSQVGRSLNRRPSSRSRSACRRRRRH